ncbi:uncharacterized protein LOC62_02G001960 [Vanrija pseudolonga]|uniref:Uncharacterized protein n=1 Tax=Vanrija pseudolonga TaxID=143232 RepID=A0AAF0Y7T1_9TREE|nr:hypothetical protein LOC62_02G001960 [Vanrija pseudolonga]
MSVSLTVTSAPTGPTAAAVPPQTTSSEDGPVRPPNLTTTISFTFPHSQAPPAPSPASQDSQLSTVISVPTWQFIWPEQNSDCAKAACMFFYQTPEISNAYSTNNITCQVDRTTIAFTKFNGSSLKKCNDGYAGSTHDSDKWNFDGSDPRSPKNSFMQRTTYLSTCYFNYMQCATYICGWHNSQVFLITNGSVDVLNSPAIAQCTCDENFSSLLAIRARGWLNWTDPCKQQILVVHRYHSSAPVGYRLPQLLVIGLGALAAVGALL